MKLVLLSAFLLFWGSEVYAKGLLEYSSEHFFDETNTPRIGIEIEIANLKGEVIASVLKSILGGQWEYVEKLEENFNIKTGVHEKYKVREIHLFNSQIGNLVIKPEENNLDNKDLAEATKKTRIFEIVTAPIEYKDVILLQEALTALQKAGAQGTADGHAVAIQVNIEVFKGDREVIQATDILRILRNYLKPSHHKSISQELAVPDFRKGYLGYFTPGMMQRVMSPVYRPSNEKFYFDFMYRQSLELLGRKDAWTASEEMVRKSLRFYLEREGFEKLLPVYKFNFIRVSAILMYLFPNDWLTKYLKRTTWFHDYPILEYREGNSDFEILNKVRALIGIMQESVRSGDFEFDAIKNELKSEAKPAQVSPALAPMQMQCFRLFHI